VNKITLRQVSDKPIGTLVRPMQLYKGFFFPLEERKNFTAWFTSSKRISCGSQTMKQAAERYEAKTRKTTLSNQFKELCYGDLSLLTNPNNCGGILKDTYVGVVTSFVYYDDGAFHLCESIEKQNRILRNRKNKYHDYYIAFLGITLYHNIDLSTMTGHTEWSYHSKESFQLLYPSYMIYTIEHLAQFEGITNEDSIITSRKQYIVLAVDTKSNKNIVMSSLTNKEVKVLTATKTKTFPPDVGFKVYV
jgi:hypothetical protein